MHHEQIDEKVPHVGKKCQLLEFGSLFVSERHKFCGILEYGANTGERDQDPGYSIERLNELVCNILVALDSNNGDHPEQKVGVASLRHRMVLFHFS